MKAGLELLREEAVLPEEYKNRAKLFNAFIEVRKLVGGDSVEKLTALHNSMREMEKGDIKIVAQLSMNSGLSFIDAKYLYTRLKDIEKCKSTIRRSRETGLSIYSLV
ncbi:hypothetical protein [Emticicia fontis]